MLRKQGVVGKFVEFFGPASRHALRRPRLMIANMAPEYGATCDLLPGRRGLTIGYLKHHRPRCRTRSSWSRPTARRRACGPTRRRIGPVHEISSSWTSPTVAPAIAGPEKAAGPAVDLEGRPAAAFRADLTKRASATRPTTARRGSRSPAPNYALISHGAVVIAAITSCTNTPMPYVMIGGRACSRKKAVERGLTSNGRGSRRRSRPAAR